MPGKEDKQFGRRRIVLYVEDKLHSLTQPGKDLAVAQQMAHEILGLDAANTHWNGESLYLNKVESIAIHLLSESDAHSIAELLVRVWPKANRPLTYRVDQLFQRKHLDSRTEAQTPRSLVIRDGPRMIAHAAVMPRTAGTTNGELTLLALAHVCTDPNVRGKQLGKQIVQAVFSLVDDGVFPFSLFQTTEQVKPFYQGLGACVAGNRFIDSTNPDRQESPFKDPVVMRYPAGNGWPEGVIDLRGPGY